MRLMDRESGKVSFGGEARIMMVLGEKYRYKGLESISVC